MDVASFQDKFSRHWLEVQWSAQFDGGWLMGTYSSNGYCQPFLGNILYKVYLLKRKILWSLVPWHICQLLKKMHDSANAYNNLIRKQWRISRQLTDYFWRWIQIYPIAVDDLVLICDLRKVWFVELIVFFFWSPIQGRWNVSKWLNFIYVCLNFIVYWIFKLIEYVKLI